MDLLNQEQPKENKTKKIVLTLLIISVIAVIITIGLMIILSSKKPKQITNENKIFVDEQESTIKVEQVLVVTDKEMEYLAIKDIASLVGQNYFNGEYLKYTEDRTKGYIESLLQIQDGEKAKNVSNIVGIEANSNKIYKTSSESETDYEYVEIKNDILLYNNNLYVSIEDVRSSIRNLCKLFREKWISNIWSKIFGRFL